MKPFVLAFPEFMSPKVCLGAGGKDLGSERAPGN